MGFFNKLKRAFGFNDDGDELDDVLDIDIASQPYINPFKPNEHDEPRPVKPDPEAETPTPHPTPAPVPQPNLQPQPAPQPQPEAGALSATAPAHVQATLDELMTLIKQMKPAEGGTGEADKQLQEELDSRAARITTLEQQLAGLRHERDVLQQRCDALEHRVGDSALGKEVSALRQVIDQLTGERDRAVKARQDAEQAAATAAEALNEAHAETEAVRATLDEANRRAGTLLETQKQMEDKLGELDTLRDTVSRLNAEVESAAAAAIEGDAAVERARAEAEAARAELAALNERVAEDERKRRRENNLRNQRDIELANQIDDLTQRLKARNRETEAQEQRLRQAESDLRAERAERRAESEAAATRLRHTESQRDEAAARRDALTIELRDMRVQLEKATTGRQALQVSLDEMQQQVATLQAELKRRASQSSTLPPPKGGGEKTRTSIETPDPLKTPNPLETLETLETLDSLETLETIEDPGRPGEARDGARGIEPPSPQEDSPSGLGDFGLDDEIEIDNDDEIVSGLDDEIESDLDDDLDDIDWLVPAPPSPPREEPDLNPEPEPKAIIDDPRQLTLF